MLTETTKDYRQVRKDLIHPWERPMRFINVLIFIVTILTSLALFASFLINLDDVSTIATEANRSISIFLIIGSLIFLLGKNYAKAKASSIRITDKQFSDVHAIIKEYSEKLELGYIPEAFIVQKGGSLNAFATSFFARKYISINSDLFEVSYLEHHDMETLSFIIAHELTHLKRKHATTLMTIVETPSRLIPIWSSANSRVKEYTCDRHAAWLCSEGIDGLIVLGIGKHLYKEVDVDEYIADSNAHYKGLFCWIVNLTASHPVLPKRMKALKNLDKRGKVF